MPMAKTCELCKKTYFVIPSDFNRRRTCSRKCHHELKKIDTRWKKKLSDSVKNQFKNGRKPMSYWTGKKQSEDMVEKRMKNSRGENHWRWTGADKYKERRIRNCWEYKKWRKAVFERDNYTCVACGKRGCYLQADHIMPFAFYEELRFSIDNGRTLCLECHKNTETFGYGTIKFMKTINNTGSIK